MSARAEMLKQRSIHEHSLYTRQEWPSFPSQYFSDQILVHWFFFSIWSWQWPRTFQYNFITSTHFFLHQWRHHQHSVPWKFWQTFHVAYWTVVLLRRTMALNISSWYIGSDKACWVNSTKFQKTAIRARSSAL